MPKWSLHRLWAIKMGIDESLARKIDEIIDFGKEYKGYKIGHDWPFGGMGKFSLAIELIHDDFGVDGVKALMLHGILDYMDYLVKNNYTPEEIYWRALAWIKFCNRKNVIRYVSRLSDDEKINWIMANEFNYNYVNDTIRDDAITAAKVVMEFVMKNFDDILYSLSSL